VWIDSLPAGGRSELFQKRVTQPSQSGKLSQLHYRRFPVLNPASFWIDE
jgi:hypothetical protein